MNNSVFKLTVVNSKAIESATIKLDTITVLSGVNAAGKSTIARMLNLMVNMSANYSLLAKRMAWRQLKDVAFQGIQLNQRLLGIKYPFQFKEGLSENFEASLETKTFQDVLTDLKIFLDSVMDLYSEMISNGDAYRAFGAFLRGVRIGEEFSRNIDQVKEILESKLRSAFEKYQTAMQNRSYDVYNFTSGSEVNWLVDADFVELKEGEDVVYQTRRNPNPPPRVFVSSQLKEIFGIKRSFYIASPWFSIPDVKENGDLTIPGDEFIHKPSSQNVDVDDDLFEILGGDVDNVGIRGENTAGQTSEWEYVREDGLKVAFRDCATGIKSLSILYLLYKKKYLDSETLLVIDEPEVHLHPQWVARYARILVQICKHLKVRMLLTSHSPDMVSAIKVMSEAENVAGVNFYCAEQSEKNKYQYSYTPLGNDIEKIFRTFGKSIDYIDNYKPVNK